MISVALGTRLAFLALVWSSGWPLMMDWRVLSREKEVEDDDAFALSFLKSHPLQLLQ